MRLGIIGTGMMARFVLPHMASWGIDVVAVCGSGRSPEKVEAIADEFCIPQRFAGFAELIACPDIDTVYVAMPNAMHYDLTMAALEAGKHVVCEKPFATNAREAQAMADRAEELGLFLWEGMMAFRQPNFLHVRDEWLGRIGDVKLAMAVFNRYSSRYDRFMAGETMQTFDPAFAGGCLMDIGVYCVATLVGLFGEPLRSSYHANMVRGIDTSGIMTMDYDGFTAVAIGAKDCAAPSFVQIEGTKGYILSPSEANAWEHPMTLHLNDGTEETFNAPLGSWWEAEWREFMRQQDAGDLAACRRDMATTLAVSRAMAEARLACGLIFPADK